jgi:hypothetical protein
MRYEDILIDPTKAFVGLIKFLDLPEELERVEKAVRFSSFDALAGQEESEGFVEGVPAKEHPAFQGKDVEEIPETAKFQGQSQIRFFRVGKLGSWRDHLTADQVSRVISDHREVMEAHGYLDEQGAPIF